MYELLTFINYLNIQAEKEEHIEDEYAGTIAELQAENVAHKAEISRLQSVVTELQEEIITDAKVKQELIDQSAQTAKEKDALKAEPDLARKEMNAMAKLAEEAATQASKDQAELRALLEAARAESQTESDIVVALSAELKACQEKLALEEARVSELYSEVLETQTEALTATQSELDDVKNALESDTVVTLRAELKACQEKLALEEARVSELYSEVLETQTEALTATQSELEDVKNALDKAESKEAEARGLLQSEKALVEELTRILQDKGLFDDDAEVTSSSSAQQIWALETALEISKEENEELSNSLVESNKKLEALGAERTPSGSGRDRQELRELEARVVELTGSVKLSQAALEDEKMARQRLEEAILSESKAAVQDPKTRELESLLSAERAFVEDLKSELAVARETAVKLSKESAQKILDLEQALAELQTLANETNDASSKLKKQMDKFKTAKNANESLISSLREQLDEASSEAKQANERALEYETRLEEALSQAAGEAEDQDEALESCRVHILALKAELDRRDDSLKRNSGRFFLRMAMRKVDFTTFLMVCSFCTI